MNWRPALFLLLCTSAFADQLREIPFDEKVREASVVLIGAVERLEPRSTYPTWAEVRVESVLKGTAPTTIRVQSRGMIAESSVLMNAGRRYPFLLTKHNDIYISVNGHYAVIPVDGKPF